ncbi:hypothetical protein N802_01790 [Knoellia sinensis KCTC 19936]|uniref:Uncharacterized protein n=1 Tax=Knoellia sinensis KCTC 19936 TaxID=1385520 RepID=A0A0A0JHD0_9MICO|nr:hypothetical protein [Knoellia sinensis]KGN35031.1 hypothetical protein N802_01790 [Knoellia sinensis KCTC 19936]
MTSKGKDVERRGSDVMHALRSADPAARVDLARTEEQAFTALREGITMSAREQSSTTKRRGRRTLVAGGLALALLGGGTAYAALNGYQAFEDVEKTWRGGGSDGGVTCLTTWVDPQSADAAKASSGGPALSADPIADCQKYQQLQGKPPIEDPAVFTHSGMTYVTPRKAVPPSAEAAPPVKPNADALMVLRASLGDYANGANSRCLSEGEAAAFVKDELARLGLTGVKVVARPFAAGDKCAAIDYDPPTGEVLIMGSPEDASRPSKNRGGGMHEVAATLRTEITEKCVPLPEAEAITAKALGKRHHWPTSAVVDEKLKCTTADLQVGGSMQVFLRGPSTTS